VLALVESRAGRPAAAARAAAEAADLSAALAQPGSQASALGELAWAEAMLGRDRDCREHVERAADLVAATRALDRVLLWFWGHEHRFAGYAPFGFDGAKVRARCIGHGGMPIELGTAPKRSDRPLVFTDEREATVLDREAIGYCGFAVLRLVGPALVVEYFDELRKKLLEERWSVGAGGVQGAVALGGELQSFRPLSDLVSS